MGRCDKECDCNIIHGDFVEKAKKKMLDEETLLFMADFYKAMSDSTRICLTRVNCAFVIFHQY